MIKVQERCFFRYIITMICAIALLPLISSAKRSAMVTGLKCEYLKNPLGIDALQPRFTWRLDDQRHGARQTAYQIWVGTDSLEVVGRKSKIWDSGKVDSESNLVVYNGEKLSPFTRYYWVVDVWDEKGNKVQGGSCANFETGMLAAKNWRGAWITDVQDVDLKPAPYFRKTFMAKNKVRSARAYVAVGGLFELSVNGKAIGDSRLNPMFTRYDRRLLYLTYDLTNELKQGNNTFGILLGNGWYNHQSTAVWDFHKAPWRARPTVCMDIHVTYEDGSVDYVVTGEDWKTDLSPLIFNSIYTAEHYDARLEQPGWNTAAFDDSKWKNAILRSAPSQNIVAQALRPIRNTERIAPVSMRKLNDSVFVYDLGRNISGVSQIKAKGPAGTTLKLKHGERLYPDGRVDISNIDYHFRPTDQFDPFQTDIFILSGKSEESFMPRFNYKGFQYVEVTCSEPVKLDAGSLVGYFMHSDVPVLGKIQTSNEMINKIWWATNNSYKSNLFGFPTDCPQREKNGWTGDAHIAIETGLYNYEGITVYEKWLDDHRDEQQPNGVLPAIIPTAGWGYSWANGPDWTSTITIIPWNVYLFYGDSRILSDNYENMKRYVDHLTEISPQGLTSWGLGDWVPVKSKSSVELTSSIYYYIDAKILMQIAKILGHQADHERYAALAIKIKDAINAKHLNTATGIYGSGLQTELSAVLYWGLVPDALKTKVAGNLAARVEADGYKIDVGLLGTKSLLNALSENGYADVAYKIVSRKTYPSWGWWIENGATTLYENWDIQAAKDISLNHIMFGEVSAWFYKALGGIKPDPQHPGFKNILLEPHFVAGLDEFESTHNGPFGLISSSWKKQKRKTVYNVVIPANSTASLVLPEVSKAAVQPAHSAEGKNIFKLQSGRYRFELK